MTLDDPLLDRHAIEDAFRRLCAEIFPEEQVPDRARLVLEDVFENL